MEEHKGLGSYFVKSTIMIKGTSGKRC